MNLPVQFTDIFTHGNLLLLGGAFLLVAAVAAFAVSVARLFTNRRTSTGRRRIGWSRKIIQLLLSVILLLLAVSALLAGSVLRTYTAFTRQELVATLECLQWRAADQVMIVRFSQIENGRLEKSRTFTLYGDLWEVNAHILKWTPKINLLGRHTLYRLNQIKGIYQLAEDENSRLHQAYALNPGRDWLWDWLNRYGQGLPFVEAVYGNAVSQIARPGATFDILVTTSGLSAIRRNP